MHVSSFWMFFLSTIPSSIIIAIFLLLGILLAPFTDFMGKTKFKEDEDENKDVQATPLIRGAHPLSLDFPIALVLSESRHLLAIICCRGCSSFLSDLTIFVDLILSLQAAVCPINETGSCGSWYGG